MISSMKAAAGGDLGNIKKIVKVVGFVSSTPDFTQQPGVINGCSDLMGAVFGEQVGRHARRYASFNLWRVKLFTVDILCNVVFLYNTLQHH